MPLRTSRIPAKSRNSWDECRGTGSKGRRDEASAREIEHYRQTQQKRVEYILRADIESLFKIEEIIPGIPAKARIMDSEICDFCGEPTKVDLLRTIDGKKVCIPCAEKYGLGNGLSSLTSSFLK